jgi:motility quorum-sensing regulator / GCU-specific mRNA interferase toxin
MQKQTHAYHLENIKRAFRRPESLGGRVTNSAFKGAQQLGLSRQDVIAVIQSLTPKGFYKSMTSYGDHRIWQDVYHARYQGRDIYLKFTAKPGGDYLLISFKER